MSQQFHTIVRKIIVWGVTLFAAAVLQTSFFARLALAIPYGAVPDLVLAVIVAIAIFDSERTGAIAGIAAGFLVSALGGTGFTLLPLVYMLCGYICGVWSTMGLSANFASWCVYMAAVGVARALTTLISVALSYPDCSLIAVLTTALIPEFLATLLVSPLAYFSVRRVALRFNRRLKIPE